MIVVVAALRRELDPFKGLLKATRQEQADGALLTEGQADGAQIALVQSGIGRERSQAATRAAIARYRPDIVVSAGFSGGLSPEVKGAELVLGQRIFAVEGSSNGAPPAELPPIASDAKLLDLVSITLEESLMPVTIGDLISVPRVMPGPREKERLAALTPAALVDMESYWVGEAAQEAGVPFLAARVASDEAGDALPDYERFMDDMGEIRPMSAAWYFFTHPHHVLGAPALAVNAHRGGRNLAAFGALLFTMAYRPAPGRR